jgi:tetratricopeptide (TPR) repeat protein
LARGDLEGAQQAFLEASRKTPERPEPHYFLGVIHLEKGEPEKAIQEFDRVLKILPDHLLSYFNIALAYLRLGKQEEAEAAFQKAIQIQPAFYPAHLELGLLYESLGRVEEAILAFQSVIRYGGDAPQAQEAVKKARERLDQTGETPDIARQAGELFKRGQEFFKNNRLKEAEADFQGILKIIPKSAPARYFLAQTILEKGDIFRATRLLEEAVKFELNAWQIYYLLGQLYQTQGRWSDATVVYAVVARILKEGPVYEDARRRLAILKAVIEEEQLREAIRKDLPLAEARTRFQQGIAAFQQEDLERAVTLIKEAVALDSTNPFYHYNLGIAYFAQTKLVEAARSIQKAIELRQDYGPAHFFLGQIYMASGDAARDAGDLVGATQEYRKALEGLERTLQLGAEQWQVEEARERLQAVHEEVGKIQEAHGHTILGTALAERKEQEGALREYRLASDLVPKDPFSRISMGVIYEEMGEIEKAIQIYEEAASASPLNPAPYINLGQLFEKEKRVEEAEKAYKTAMERSPRMVEPVTRLGTLYFEQDRMEEAQTQYQKAITLDPKQPEPHFYLGQIYERQNKEKEAVQAYQAAQALIPPQLDTSRYIRDRLRALDRFSARWSHSFFNYDNNANASSTNPRAEISSSFSLGFNYILFRRTRLHPVLPLPLSIPLDISTGTSTFLRTSRLTNRETASLSIQTVLGTAYDMGLSYSFNFSQTDERPTALNQSWSFAIARTGQIPGQVSVAVSYSSLASLVNSANNRSTQGIGVTTSQSLGGYGSMNFGYSYTTIKAQRLDQSGKNHDFTFGYSSPLFGKLRISTGLDYSTTTFDVPRVLPGRGGASIVQSIEKNNTLAFRIGGSYPLGSGVTLSFTYRRLENSSNLDIPRPPVDITQQELELVESTDSYQKDVFGLSVSKSF